MTDSFEKFGRFLLLRSTGSTSLGTLYRAARLGTSGAESFHRLLRVDSAISVSDEFSRELSRIREWMLALRHPSILGLNHVGRIDGRIYLAWDDVLVLSLRDILSRRATEAFDLSHRSRLEVIRRVATALHHAHSGADGVEIAHGGLCPESICIDADGVVRVGDFGLLYLEAAAGLYREGSETPRSSYISPEVWAGDSPTIRSDIYQLGLVLLETLGGKPPASGELFADELETVESVLQASDLASDEPATSLMRNILRGCLHRDPEQRIETIEAVQEQLEEAWEKTEGASGSELAVAVNWLFQDQIDEESDLVGAEGGTPFSEYFSKDSLEEESLLLEELKLEDAIPVQPDLPGTAEEELLKNLEPEEKPEDKLESEPEPEEEPVISETTFAVSDLSVADEPEHDEETQPELVQTELPQVESPFEESPTVSDAEDFSVTTPLQIEAMDEPGSRDSSPPPPSNGYGKLDEGTSRRVPWVIVLAAAAILVVTSAILWSRQGGLREERNELQEEVSVLRTELSNRDVALEEAHARLTTFESEIGELRKSLSDANANIGRIQKDVEGSVRKARESTESKLQQEISVLENELVNTRQQYDDLKATLDTSREAWGTERNSLAGASDELSDRIELRDEKIAELEKSKAVYQRRIVELEKQAAAVNEEEKQAVQEIVRQLGEVRRELRDAETERKRLEDENSRLRTENARLRGGGTGGSSP